jgi:hypothetical protein
MKWLIAAASLLFVVGSPTCYLYFSGKAELLVLERGRTIQVNGVPVRGEVLRHRGVAIVTRRDAGKEHSYQIFSAGDVDMTGDIGSVGDCKQWVAPHLPFLIVIPPCTRSGPGHRLTANPGGPQFATADKSIIQIN